MCVQIYILSSLLQNKYEKNAQKSQLFFHYSDNQNAKFNVIPPIFSTISNIIVFPSNSAIQQQAKSMKNEKN
jgi:hypothetical protein